VTVNLLGIRSDPDLVEPQLRKELIRWIGTDVERWGRLAIYRLPAALPNQAPPVLYPGARKVLVSEGLWVCGELGGAPSIQWALHSGTRAGESVSAALLGRHSRTTKPEDRADQREEALRAH